MDRVVWVCLGRTGESGHCWAWPTTVAGVTVVTVERNSWTSPSGVVIGTKLWDESGPWGGSKREFVVVQW